METRDTLKAYQWSVKQYDSEGRRLGEAFEIWITWPNQLSGQTGTQIYVAVFMGPIIRAELRSSRVLIAAFVPETNYPRPKTKDCCSTWVVINATVLYLSYIRDSRISIERRVVNLVPCNSSSISAIRDVSMWRYSNRLRQGFSNCGARPPPRGGGQEGAWKGGAAYVPTDKN
jgi:hypothetical protein